MFFSRQLAATTFMLAASTSVIAAEIDVIEFYNPDLNHYFITNPSEAALLDGGAAGSWQRTGYTFKAAGTQTNGFSPTCRFYNQGANSHFYAADPTECGYLKSLNPGNILADNAWTYEGITFHIQTPTNGVCPAETSPVYRLYNNRGNQGDSNHRYTTENSVVNEMKSKGWVQEGVAMCAVNPPLSANQLACEKTARLAGKWKMSYTLGATQFNSFFTFNASDLTEVDNDDTPCILLGYDTYGNADVGGMYSKKLGKWMIIDLGTLFNAGYVVTFTNSSRLDGTYMQIYGNGTSSPSYPVYGTRVSSNIVLSAGTDSLPQEQAELSQSNKIRHIQGYEPAAIDVETREAVINLMNNVKERQ